MYILKGFFVKNKWFYFIPILSFLGIVIISLFTPSSGNEIQKIINLIGELPTFSFILSPYVIMLLGLFFVVKFIHFQSITNFTTSRKKIDFKRVLLSFCIWGIFICLETFISYLCFPNDYVWNFNFAPFIILVFLSFLLIPFQAGFEEYFFRAYLLQALGLISKNKFIPLIISSLIFGLVHIANPEIIKMGYGFLFFYILLGLFMGILVLMDEGLELSLGFHIANNIFIALLVTSDWTAFQTPSILKEVNNTGNFSFYQVGIYILVLSGLLYFFSRVYKWTNWKEKLFGKIEKPKEENGEYNI
ncbi:MAG: type II CAAX endopeptidase family protein [Capnocytophaga sp.]|nr:type II CAAX endopeptidase family protein [Capnocytophaga sp.]